MKPLAAVQALRAFAAVVVLIGHTLEEVETRFGADFHHVLRLSWLAGVDIFFVISGFIMVTASWNRYARPGAPRLFLLHRFVRVVPLYWIFTTLIVLTLLASPSALGATRFDPGQIVSSYLFWPYQRHDGAIQPVLSVGWTLNYELFFYAIFAATLLLPRRQGLAALFAMLVGLPLAGALLRPAAVPLIFWTDPIILEFAFGAAVGVLYLAGPRWTLPTMAAVPAALASLVLFMAARPLADAIGFLPPRIVLTGLTATLVVLLATVTMPERADARTPRLLQWIGDGSYSLYLSHRFGLRIATLLLGRLIQREVIGPWAFVAGTVLVCIALGQIVHLFLEKPLIRLFRHVTGARVTVDHQKASPPIAG